MHPVLFRLDSQTPVYSYGTVVMIAIGLGAALGVLFARRDRLPVAMLVLGAILGAYVGARGLGYLVAWLGIETEDGVSVGLFDYGALLGGAGALAIVARFRRVPFAVLADAAAPPAALACGLNRLGCYLFGCDYGVALGPGAPAPLAWLGTFPRWEPGLLHSASMGSQGSPAWSQQVHMKLIDITAAHSLPVHPTQLYLLAGSLGIFVVLLQLRPRRAFQGQIVLTFVIAYGILRFAVDFFLLPENRPMVGPLSVVQWLALLAGGAALAALRPWRARPPWSPVPLSPFAKSARDADAGEPVDQAEKRVKKRRKRAPRPAGGEEG